MSQTIDWQRCVHLDRPIDEDLIRDLLPKILNFRQQSDAPITIALNSPGGAVGLIQTIRSLVRGPNQDGTTCSLVTVAVHKAYSAAAMLLAMGDYAVALPHAEILFHDVRYGSVRDVTPTSALKAAESLEANNDRAALDIANRMFPRWMWMYLDIHDKTPALKANHPEQCALFDEAVKWLAIPTSAHVRLDLVGLLLFIFQHLRVDNECVLDNALQRMTRWSSVTNIAKHRPLYRRPGSRLPGTLDGLAQVFKELNPKESLKGRRNEADLGVFMTVLAASLSNRSAKDAISLALREMTMFSSMNDENHWQTAVQLMLNHKYTFFQYEIIEKWDSLSEGEREQIADESKPIVRALWLLCVQVARELFSGEHRLKPSEAMVLGLVDEVPGYNVFESRRQFDISAVT
ncbi:ATP-dependent protease ClpP protease subunit [Pelomonas aquatica]|uniref:ATP-dependent protease ClpP protease subunit n=1 Tax=Pelomonas aquatica TaxID=431058 RepID=A0ABU1Z5M7_9BURK|nr:ATP-dependent Clp protease proteolytic subunit [Pelomonas aquatica]MDR7295923.1 ATP-dependent protease ClpP protease subunit [Pelomonas aquatica]